MSHAAARCRPRPAVEAGNAFRRAVPSQRRERPRACGRYLHVVADDEHHLGTLDLQAPDGELQLFRFRAGDLPADRHERKRSKPDLEALAMLPPEPGWPQGALLAFGSGSRPQRQHAFLLALDADGRIAGPPRALDLGPLYAPLRERFTDLNIEGAFVAGGRMHLLQRAHRRQPRNACVSYDLVEMLSWIGVEACRTAAPSPVQCTDFALGTAAGVPYGFTDGAAWPGGGWVFTAVAEDTEDSYADGRCAGSAVGWVSGVGALLDLQVLAGAPKVEGVAVTEDSGLLLVTDADDPQVASRLYALRAGAGVRLRAQPGPRADGGGDS
ncbi:hypothetical protein WG902_21230 [Ramlibacter sp. PS3R-8]|uniref:DUF6910 family protein n=1 Tax=Ramlibacter sp. PS3R-8 TaxID=3133437 RepID=UPI00309662B5